MLSHCFLQFVPCFKLLGFSRSIKSSLFVMLCIALSLPLNSRNTWINIPIVGYVTSPEATDFFGTSECSVPYKLHYSPPQHSPRGSGTSSYLVGSCLRWRNTQIVLLYSVVEIWFSAYSSFFLWKCASNFFGINPFQFCVTHPQVPSVFEGSVLLAFFILPRRGNKCDSYLTLKTMERSSNYS